MNGLWTFTSSIFNAKDHTGVPEPTPPLQFQSQQNQSLMKYSLWLSSLIFLLLSIFPHPANSAIAKPQKRGHVEAQAATSHEVKPSKRVTIRERFGRKVAGVKSKWRLWRETIAMGFPTGHLLTSLILLVLSIVLFAVGGATKFGVLFSALGSVAIIGAVVFFVIWLSDRSKAALPPSD